MFTFSNYKKYALDVNNGFQAFASSMTLLKLKKIIYKNNGKGCFSCTELKIIYYIFHVITKTSILKSVLFQNYIFQISSKIQFPRSLQKKANSVRNLNH